MFNIDMWRTKKCSALWSDNFRYLVRLRKVFVKYVWKQLWSLILEICESLKIWFGYTIVLWTSFKDLISLQFHKSIEGRLLNFLDALSLGLMFMWLPNSVKDHLLRMKVNTLSRLGITENNNWLKFNPYRTTYLHLLLSWSLSQTIWKVFFVSNTTIPLAPI